MTDAAQPRRNWSRVVLPALVLLLPPGRLAAEPASTAAGTEDTSKIILASPASAQAETPRQGAGTPSLGIDVSAVMPRYQLRWSPLVGQVDRVN